MNVLAKVVAIFFLLWLLAGFLFMAFNQYVLAGVFFATWCGLYLWSFLRKDV